MAIDEGTVYQPELSKIAKNAGISGIGEISFKVLGYITSIVITRTVGPAIFGIFILANIITNIGHIFSSLGLGEGLLRFVAFYKGREDIPRLKGMIIFSTKVVFLLSLFLTMVIFYSSDLIANRLFHNPEVGGALKILIISIPFLAIGGLWLNSIQSFQIIKYQVYIQKIYQPVIRLISLVIFFLLGLKLVGILLAGIISAFVGAIFAFYYLKKIFPIHRRLPVPVYEKRKIINFSMPLYFNQFLNLIILSIGFLMLGYFRTSVEVGIYAAATKVAVLVALPLASFNTIFAPMISEFYSRNEMSKLEGLFKIVTKWIFVLSLPVFLLFILFAQPIMGIFGGGFVAGALVLIVLGGGELINAGVGSVGYILMMTGRSKIILLNSSILCALNILLNYMLIPRYGIIGAGIATGLSIALINILRLAEVYYFLKIHPYKLTFLKPCVAGFLSFFLINLITTKLFPIPISIFNMAVLSLIYVSLYALFIFLLKLEKEDKYILKLIYQELINFKIRISNTRQ